jgi:hypothetical protein
MGLSVWWRDFRPFAPSENILVIGGGGHKTLPNTNFVTFIIL